MGYGTLLLTLALLVVVMLIFAYGLNYRRAYVRSLEFMAKEFERQEAAILAQYCPYPHCDANVLHAPGHCVICDEFPADQQDRIERAINFTGEHFSHKMLCPSEQARPLGIINLWHGNTPWSY